MQDLYYEPYPSTIFPFLPEPGLVRSGYRRFRFGKACRAYCRGLNRLEWGPGADDTLIIILMIIIIIILKKNNNDKEPPTIV